MQPKRNRLVIHLENKNKPVELKVGGYYEIGGRLYRITDEVADGITDEVQLYCMKEVSRFGT